MPSATGKPILSLRFAVFCALAAGAGFATTAAQAPPSETSSTTIQVVPRTQDLGFYPCTQCHARLPTNAEPREVLAHRTPFNHGGGRIWCLDCHQADQRDQLIAHGSGPYTFDEAPEICAGCHQQRYKDWRGGAHGKSVEHWQGQRVVYSCTHCHDPHDPSIKPRAPGPPPSVRRGLEAPRTEPDVWQPSWQPDNARENQ